MPKRDLAYAVATLIEQVASYQAQLDKWQARFRENPVHALIWSNETFLVAAKFELCSQLLPFLSGDTNPGYMGDRVECASDQYSRDLLSSSSGLNQSTSPTSNLMDDCRRVAKVDLLQWLRGERGIM